MNTLTRQEQWALFVVLVLLLGGLAGKVWLRHQDPAPASTAVTHAGR